MDRDNGDQPLSSEEMLRRARAGLGDSGTTPPAPKDTEESYTVPKPEPDYEMDSMSEMEPVFEDDDALADAYKEPRAYEPPQREEAPPEVIGDGVGHWAPPRADPGEAAGGWAPPQAETS